jgi:hypothetical protein
MAHAASTATLTTALTRITDTVDRYRAAGKSNSTTFTAMRHATDEAIRATPAMKRVANVRSPDIGVEATAGAMDAVRAQSE